MSTKGTKFAEAAIDRLKAEGYNIVYECAQRLPNEQIFAKMRDLDIIIDQLIKGWYAMTAMEAMASGKVCICYLRDDLNDTYVKIGCLEKGEIPLISDLQIIFMKFLRRQLRIVPDGMKQEKVKRICCEETFIGCDWDFFQKISGDIGIR